MSDLQDADEDPKRESQDRDDHPEVEPDPDLISYRNEVVKPDPELESHEGKAAPEPETRRKEPARR